MDVDRLYIKVIINDIIEHIKQKEFFKNENSKIYLKEFITIVSGIKDLLKSFEKKERLTYSNPIIPNYNFVPNIRQIIRVVEDKPNITKDSIKTAISFLGEFESSMVLLDENPKKFYAQENNDNVAIDTLEDLLNIYTDDFRVLTVENA